jgi:bifunctional non-homologous end joining protein LigD
MPKKTQVLKIDGRDVPVSNLEKVLYPTANFTKGQVIDYYTRVSPYMLPHLKGRPVTLKRFPDGVSGQFFYEKDAPRFTPDWVKTFPVPRREGGHGIRYILINDLPTLVWVANIASLEIHPFLHRAPHLERPTAVVFDLDPGEGSDILTCAEAAFLIRDALDHLGLECFPKVSGSKGIQLYIPLNTPTDYQATQPFAKAIADSLCEQHPDLVVSTMAKRARTAKVFIDWSQNSDFKTTVAVYSLRAKSDRPFVSAPVTWDELQAALKAKNASKLYFEPDEALRCFERTGDLFEQVLTLKQRLPKTVLANVGAHTPRLSDKQDDKSELRGRTTEQVAQAADPQGQSKRVRPAARPRKEPRQSAEKPSATPDLRSLPKATLDFIEPMLARLVKNPPEGPQWSYELKLDGFRCLVVKKEKDVVLFSRRGNRLNGQFPVLPPAFKKLPSGTVLDGEIVAPDERGRPSFNALQNWRSAKQPILFYAFDLLAYRGKDVRGLPFAERRRLLEEFALSGLRDPVRLSPTLHESASELVKAAREQGLEGIVAKRTDSVYESGKRTGAWSKLKTAQGQELVVGGYIPGPHVFDSLLVGYYDDGKLMFVAKVRNGFVPESRRAVAQRFRGLETAVCPFANLPEPQSARQGKALTKEFMKECRWLKPQLVAQVEFADWTKANNLRQSSFAGLREDKDAREVTHETAA